MTITVKRTCLGKPLVQQDERNIDLESDLQIRAKSWWTWLVGLVSHPTISSTVALVGWMASLMQRTWIGANFRRWWGTQKPGMLQSMELRRVRHDLATEQYLWTYSTPTQLQVTGRCVSQKWMLVLHPWIFGWVFSSVQFSRSVVSNSLRPHELQHARPPCPSPTPGVHPNPCPSSQWCHPAISSSAVPFSSCPQSLSASESFPMSQLFAGGGQSTGVSALASFLPKNTQDWSPYIVSKSDFPGQTQLYQKCLYDMWSPIRARPRESHACTFTAQKHGLIQVHHFCCCLVTQSCPTFWDPHGLQHTRTSLSFTISQSLLKLMSIESMMPCSHLISSSLPSPPAFNLSQHQDLFQWVSSYIKGPKYWSFSFSISPSNEYSGLISFRIDWFELHHYIISIIIIYIRIARFSKDFDTLHSSHTSRTSYLLFISML